MQQASFDIYATSYDNHFTGSLIGRAQREVVHNYLKRFVDLNGNILEVNCGTGEDALFFLKSCKSITCTDISEGMVLKTKLKTAAYNNITTLVSSTSMIAEMVNKKYDLIFSDFGGLNCLNEAELKNFFYSLARITQTNSELVFVIMGRKCLWERLYFRFKGDKSKAWRRTVKDGVIANLGSATQLTFYYSPKEIIKMTNNLFEVKGIRPVGFFIPPSYLNPYFERHKFLFLILSIFDKITRPFKFFANQADHYLIHLKFK